MNPLFESIIASPFRSFLAGYSALDAYLGIPAPGYCRIFTEAGLIDLSMLYETAVFPGEGDIDAVAVLNGTVLLFTCQDKGHTEPERQLLFSELNAYPWPGFFKDLKTGSFIDRDNLYPVLREIKKNTGRPGKVKETGKGKGPLAAESEAEQGMPPIPDLQELSWNRIAVMASELSRYGRLLTNPAKAGDRSENSGEQFSILKQRELLALVLTGRDPAAGLEFLRKSGFIDAHWPEIASLFDISHSKEYHPEGGLWDHTLATFSYRKTSDLTISLALLLHDAGKPLSRENEGRAFDRHAQIGAHTARRFLSRLGYKTDIIEAAVYVVREHMLPAAVTHLPASRVEKVLSSPLFPLLLEVYRCDLSSTFRGPEGYYAACKAYKKYLRNSKNPFRDASGKKLVRMYVE